MDNSPTALFDSYAQDFQQLITSVREKLEAPSTNGEQRKASLRRVEMELDETWADSTEDYIEQVCHFSFAPVCGLTGHRKSWTEKEISLERIVLVVRNFSNPSTMAISITMNTSG